MANLKYKNKQTGQWEEIKVDTRLATFKNRVKLPAPNTTVGIGVEKFNPADDVLLVYKNSVYITEGDDYILDTGLISIRHPNFPSGTWSKDTIFDFVLFKNAQREIHTSDGALLDSNSITNDKLATTIKIGSLLDLNTINKSTVVGAINGVNSNVETLKGSNDEVVLNLGNLSELNTPNKTNIVRSVNSVNTNLNNLTSSHNTTVSNIGNLINLNTTDKTSIVNALNSVNTALGSLSGSYGSINGKVGDTSKLGLYPDIVEAIIKQGADVKYFGAKGDGVTNDTAALKAAIAFADTYKCKLIISAGEYVYNESLKLPTGIVVNGVGKYRSILKPKGAIKAIDMSDETAKTGVDLNSFAIDGDNTVGQVGMDLNYVTNASDIHNIRIQNVDIGVRMAKSWYHAISRIYIRNCLSYGLHVKSVSPLAQVNATKFQHLFIQECLHNVFLDGSQNVSAAANFDTCTFEKSRRTSVIANGFSPLSFDNVYFEANYTDGRNEVLTWNSPIDLKLSGTDVRNIVKISGCYFARLNDFRYSIQKTSIYSDMNIRLDVASTQFVCNTSDYIDANIYSVSKYAATIRNCQQDGYAKSFYIGKQKEDVVVFQKEYNLRYNSNLNASGVVLNDGDYYIRFLAHQSGTVDKQITIAVKGLVSGEQFGSGATLPTLFSANSTVDIPIGYISGVKVIELQAALSTTTDLKGTIYLVRKHND